jgi:hypothetical protein
MPEPDITRCRVCGVGFEGAGTKHGLPAPLWDYLQHLHDEHGE